MNKIIAAINEMTDSELVALNNAYCESANCPDDEIFSNDEDFFNTFFANNPAEVARSIHFGDYKWHHTWVQFNGYGNLESIEYMDGEKLPISVAGMAKYIAEHQEDFTDVFDMAGLELSELLEETTED